jgi:hypothetical protein
MFYNTSGLPILGYLAAIYQLLIPNFAVEWLALFSHIQEVPSSNVGSEIDCPSRHILG